jgi:hypothetical protein
VDVVVPISLLEDSRRLFSAIMASTWSKKDAMCVRGGDVVDIDDDGDDNDDVIVVVVVDDDDDDSDNNVSSESSFFTVDVVFAAAMDAILSAIGLDETKEEGEERKLVSV